MERPLILNCREVSRFAAEGGELPLLARMHLVICAHCRRFLRQMRVVGEAARALAERSVDPVKLLSLQNRLISRLSKP